MAAKSREPTTDGVEILRRRYVEGRPEMEAMLEEERANADVARLIHALRTEAGLTQRALAARAGTHASVICQLEDADYQGHSLALLRRIAAALGKRVEIRFVPVKVTRPVAQATRRKTVAKLAKITEARPKRKAARG